MRFAEEQWLWLLLLVPALGVAGWWGERAARRALARWCAPDLWPRLVPGLGGGSWLRALLGLLGVAALVLAAARPQMGSRTLAAERRGIDVFVALDVSQSMLAEDLKPDRLTRARQSVHSLMDRLRGDRIGLVAFAGEAFVQCPLTLDYAAARMFLRYMDTDLIPVPGTAIARAIEAATTSFDANETKFKALVLITDGEDHEGEVLAAAREAKEAGVRIFAVAIGTEKGEPIPLRDERGKLIDYKRDGQGQVVLTHCDPSVLQQICEETGGRFYDGNAGDLALDPLYREISEMEEKELKGGIVTQYEERYAYFAAAGLLLLAVEWLLRERRARRRPTSAVARGAAGLIATGILGALALAAGPVFADAGTRAYEAGRYEEARDAYEAWLAKHPGDGRAQYDLGTTLLRTGEMEPAERTLQAAMRSGDPKLEAKSWYNLGSGKAKAGDLAGARDAFRNALRVDPKHRDAKANLEIVNQMLAQAPPDSAPKQEQQENDSEQPNRDEQSQDQQPSDDPSESEDPSRSPSGEDSATDDASSERQQESPSDDARSDEEAREEPQPSEQGDDGRSEPGEAQQESAPRDPMAISPEEARRLLEALAQQELLLQADRMTAKVRSRPVGRDW